MLESLGNSYVFVFESGYRYQLLLLTPEQEVHLEYYYKQVEKK